MSPSPIPDTDAAIRFLADMHAGRTAHLVAIQEGKALEAMSFAPSDEAEMRTWIDERQGIANLYVHVNELHAKIRNRKAKKEDVHLAHFLHLDVDDVNALPRLRGFSPRPTSVVFSGGGYQAFWKLDTPSSDLDKVERANLFIADELGGDNCHNIDRIMRVAGTINVPNRVKRSKGRIAALAHAVVELTDWTRTYPIEAFQEKLPDPPSSGGAAVAQIDIRPHIHLDELPPKVSEATRRLIEQGDDTLAPRGSPQAHFPSRSEAVFRVCCDLLKGGCSPEVVASILLDPAYRISDSVREKANAMRYAVRQITNASHAVGVVWPDGANNGRPKATYTNTVVALRRLGCVGSNDQFHRRKSLNGATMQVFQGDLSDDLCALLRAAIYEDYGFDPGKAHVIDAANFLCLENTHHPIRDYLTNIQWDGKARLETWLIDYLGADDTPLNRAISRIVLIAAVRRVREPGAKFDNILVLEGRQGSGKSTAIRILAGDDNFSDQDILTLDAKQQMEAMEGVWIYEISELSGLNRGEVQKVKSFASRQVDQGRMAYARFRENRPRETIFIGTTNEENYLRDTTGNRRFWPVATGTTIDLEGLRRDRDLLWAEAAVFEERGESIFLPPELWPAAAAEQEARLEDHPWLETLSTAEGEVANGKERVTTDHLLTQVLRIDVERRLPHQVKLLAALMRQLGWDGPKKFKVGGRTLRGYERDADPSAPPVHHKERF